MDTTLWIALGAAIAVIIYVLVMYAFYYQSRALDRQVDHSKLKRWADDDDW